MERTYLGDGVYAWFDEYQIWVGTTDGDEDTNRIALEREVMSALLRFADKTYGRREG